MVQVCQMNLEIPQAGLISSSAATEAELNELCCLYGDKPFFSMVLSRSHVESPHNMGIPKNIVHCFPHVIVPMVLTNGDRKWNMSFNGNSKRRKFEYSGWRAFVADNNLKCGDACIFEIMESSNTIVRLRVLILRKSDNLPPELAALIESRGKTAETAIELD